MSFEADFYTEGSHFIAAGASVRMIFWWNTPANASNYQDVWIAPQNSFLFGAPDTGPALTIGGFGTTVTDPSFDPNSRTHHWRTITNNLAANLSWAFNLIRIPSEG